MKSNQSAVRLIGFSDIFKADTKKSLGEYLDGMGKITLVNLCAHFLSLKANDPIHSYIPRLVREFFGTSNKTLLKEVASKLISLSKKREVRVLNNIALLEILEYAIEHVDESESFNEVQIKENFLKAILKVNEDTISKQGLVGETIGNVDGFPKVAYLYLTNLIPYADLENLNKKELLTSQVIRVIKLLKYISANPKLTIIYKEFLLRYQVDNWKDYIKNFISIPFQLVIDTRKGKSEINITEQDKKEQASYFLDQFSIDGSEDFPKDFLTIRNSPLYKTAEYKYLVLFDVFTIEKIFKSVYFQLNQINSDLPNEVKIANFKSEYCDKFSEQVSFYDVLRYIFRKVPCKYSGKQILEKVPNLEGEPDYFVKRELKRGKTKIFIFESKDVFINTDVKTSYNFNLYREELKKKFYYDTKVRADGSIKIKPKAILQIIENIKRTCLKELKFEGKYHRKRMNIYPVLVIHNNQIDVPGVNFLLNEWFNEELVKLKSELGSLSYLINKVEQLVLINIDTLIHYQDVFVKMKLEKVLEAYYDFINYPILLKNIGVQISEEITTQAIEPFCSFCNNYMAEKGISKAPLELLALGKELFKV